MVDGWSDESRRDRGSQRFSRRRCWSKPGYGRVLTCSALVLEADIFRHRSEFPVWGHKRHMHRIIKIAIDHLIGGHKQSFRHGLALRLCSSGHLAFKMELAQRKKGPGLLTGAKDRTMDPHAKGPNMFN
jgi:hypothetical protein